MKELHMHIWIISYCHLKKYMKMLYKKTCYNWVLKANTEKVIFFTKGEIVTCFFCASSILRWFSSIIRWSSSCCLLASSYNTNNNMRSLPMIQEHLCLKAAAYKTNPVQQWTCWWQSPNKVHVQVLHYGEYLNTTLKATGISHHHFKSYCHYNMYTTF